MTQVVEAIYQNGTFRVIQPKDIPLREGQNVRLTIESDEKNEDVLTLAVDVYEGLSEAQIDEVEKIALDRTEFFEK